MSVWSGGRGLLRFSCQAITVYGTVHPRLCTPSHTHTYRPVQTAAQTLPHALCYRHCSAADCPRHRSVWDQYLSVWHRYPSIWHRCVSVWDSYPSVWHRYQKVWHRRLSVTYLPTHQFGTGTYPFGTGTYQFGVGTYQFWTGPPRPSYASRHQANVPAVGFCHPPFMLFAASPHLVVHTSRAAQLFFLHEGPPPVTVVSTVKLPSNRRQLSNRRRLPSNRRLLSFDRRRLPSNRSRSLRPPSVTLQPPLVASRTQSVTLQTPPVPLQPLNLSHGRQQLICFCCKDRPALPSCA